jgi:mRNA interferase RelE/StbE
MQIEISQRARKQYEGLPASTVRQMDKQLSFLIKNLTHPSLRAKKYDESSGIWQARVNKDWRFYFVIHSDRYTIISIVKHPK